MNLLTRRAVARIGVGATALAAAALIGAASPAHADDTADLELSASGSTLTAGASSKLLKLSLKNNGPSVPTGVVITMDLSKIVATKVSLDTKGCTDKGAGLWDCPLEADEVPQPNGTFDLAFKVTQAQGATPGEAGTVTFAVSHAGTDDKAGNNSVSVNIVIGAAGTDLSVFADDVKQAIKLDGDGAPVFEDDWWVFTGPLTPGGVGLLEYAIVNQGDTHLAGAKITIKLPANTEFAYEYLGCTYSDDRRTSTCTWDDLPMIPADEDTNLEDEVYRGWNLAVEVRVAAGVTAPASLTGGEVSAEPILAPQVQNKSKSAAPKLAKGISEDVDPSDNVDGFAVHVAKKAGGGGTLPITGVKAGVIGGAGAAVLVAGTAMFLAARRRRVVLVSPTD